MNKNELSAGTAAEKRTEVESIPSASLVQNGVLSAAFSVEEGNRLIVEFLGYKKKAFLEGYAGTFFYKGRERFCQIGMMKYHSSWDWLMPVVEKINKTLEPLTVSLTVTTAGVFLTKIHNAICEVDIKLAHSEIVSAIKWYNDNAVSVGSR